MLTAWMHLYTLVGVLLYWLGLHSFYYSTVTVTDIADPEGIPWSPLCIIEQLGE